jgi:hypothetical protein
MANATPKAARKGYELFLAGRPPLTRAEINRRLKAAGETPISERMYDHYSRLRRKNLQQYVPINQLDVDNTRDNS